MADHIAQHIALADDVEQEAHKFELLQIQKREAEHALATVQSAHRVTSTNLEAKRQHLLVVAHKALQSSKNECAQHKATLEQQASLLAAANDELAALRAQFDTCAADCAHARFCLDECVAANVHLRKQCDELTSQQGFCVQPSNSEAQEMNTDE
jgi:chromosome segregation ATPase